MLRFSDDKNIWIRSIMELKNIISESTDPIHLITELKPIEIRLNEIKATLKRQELEASEGEKKKTTWCFFWRMI